MASPIYGTHTPIHWDIKEFNLGITYNNGIITITEPGYYRITATCNAMEKSERIRCSTYVNASLYLDTTSAWASPGVMHGIKYLNVFDTVYFNKSGNKATQGGKYKNYFTIEKL